MELTEEAEPLKSRLVGGLNRLATRGARRVRHAAQELRTSPVVQHAIAARERGNLEAAFWLLNEEFTRHPDEAGIALHYWDVALSLGRVDIASDAGVKLIESKAAAGEPELAAQHWLELIKEAPTVLVSPATIATILPALKTRLAAAPEDSPDDRRTLGGYLRRAVRHAVDPRNKGLHPGVALRIFEEGREINPEAARRAAEAALESPNLHDAKRQRLTEWLGDPSSPGPQQRTAVAAEATPERAIPDAAGDAGLSAEEIEIAAARLPKAKAKAKGAPNASAPANVSAGKCGQPDVPKPKPAELQEAKARGAEESKAEEAGRAEAAESGPRVTPATLTGLGDEALILRGAKDGGLRYDEIQAVAVAEIIGLEDGTVTVIDLILNWTCRHDARLEIVRLRVDELDLSHLVTRKHALGSDFAALMGDIMERTSAIPLPDPESALGTRLSCFASPDLYERIALRAAARPGVG